ncbi:MAG: NUDIX hydrolase [Bacteroidales bacterium]
MEKTRIKNWKVLDSKRIFNKSWLNVRNITYKLPNGTILKDYFITDYPDWISVIAITETGEFVMERQFRPGINGVSLEICGGVIEKTDVNNEEAARRELSEETGYEGGKWTKILDICPNAGAQSNKVHVYLAKGVKKVTDMHLDTTEDIEVFLMKEKEVLEALKNNEICQAIHVASLWKYFGEKSLITFAK